MAWTNEQQRAIDLDRKNILVSAAAGSGKTAVLVERIVSHLLRSEDEADAWNVDELLVVTFTRAAAAEMSERIGKRLEQAITAELGQKKPDKKLISRLQRQSILLSNASISTIDSFCQSIIKNNFSALDLDPKFRVADENELTLLKQDVLEELFELRYSEDDAALLLLGEVYGTDRGDDGLYDIILKLHTQAMNQPFPRLWLENLAAAFGDGTTHAQLSEYELWWSVVTGEIQQGLAEARHALNDFGSAAEMVDEEKIRQKYETVYSDRKATIERIEAALSGEWADIYEAFQSSLEFSRMPTVKTGQIDDELKAEMIDANNTIKDVLKNLKESYVLADEETFLADLAHLAATAGALVDVTWAFAEAFRAIKKEKNIIDYNDMEHFALDLLLADGSTMDNLQPSETALALQRRYKEIMVDEYQDTNEVQDTIVRLIAGENTGKLFMVGDVKQSIYGFRSSEPTLFMHKYEAYVEEGDTGIDELISLGRNFRSRKEVLSAVNFIFAQLMSKSAANIDYDTLAMLNPGEPYGYAEPEQGKIMPLARAIELDIIAKNGSWEQEAAGSSASSADTQDDEPAGEELKGFQAEAQLIADRLKALKTEDYMVFDKNVSANNGYRPIEWRDMVILLRATSNKADVLQEILQANDIPVFAGMSGGYFQATEIQVMTSLLAVIDNAQQDIPLAAVLYSPLVGLSAEQLAKVRLVNTKDNLYLTILQANQPEVELSAQIKNKLAAFLEQLSSWRRLAQRSSVSELLWQIYQDTGYYDYVGCMPGGVLRQANLRMLIARAESFEATNYRGLFRFLGFIAKMKDMETDLDTARTLGENEDVVRVMSIHKSKGLEFPVVVIADMGKKFNLQDTTDAVILDKNIGLGLHMVNTEQGIKYPSFARLAVKAWMEHESRAEELRVLYVAMTRAREKLIMVGSVQGTDKTVRKWCKYCSYQAAQIADSVDVTDTQALLQQTLPDYAVHGANSYMDWLGMAVARHEAGAAFAPFIGLTEGEYRQLLGHMQGAMGHKSQWHVNLVDGAGIVLPQTAGAAAGGIIEKVVAGEELPVEAELAESTDSILSWQYDFRGTEHVAAKLSVSELKARFAEELQDGLEPVVMAKTQLIKNEPNYTYQRPNFMQRSEEEKKPRLSGAEYGTLMHCVMQHLDLSLPLDKKSIEAEIARFVAQEIITEAQAKMIHVGYIVHFFESPLGQRMLQTREVWRELPFSRMLPASRYYPEVTDETAKIFNQGVVDAIFVDAEGKLVLLDYKTDKDTTPDVVREKYHLQLQLYSEVMAGIFGRPVDEKYLYMLRDGSVIKL